MLAMMPVIADYLFKMFITFCILQSVTPNVAGPGLTYPSNLPPDRPGCVNNVLINVLKKLTQCINVLKIFLL